MQLKQRQYKAIDVLKIGYGVSKPLILCLLLFTIVEAIVSTFVVALTTANFIERAELIFSGRVEMTSIYPSMIILLATLGVMTFSGNLVALIHSSIQNKLEQEMLPLIIDKQITLAYKYVETDDYWELSDRLLNEMSEYVMDGISAYMSLIHVGVAMSSIILLITQQLWWAGIIVLMFSCPLIVVAMWAGRHNYAAKVATKEYEHRYSYYSDEMLTNREVVEERTLFDYTQKITDHYYHFFKKARDIQLAVLLKTKVVMKLTGTLSIIVAGITGGLFIPLVIAGQMNPGIFIGIIAALFGLVDILGEGLQEAVKHLAEAREFMNDLTTLMTWESVAGVLDLPDKDPLTFNTLEFINVSFKYPKTDQYVLKNVSFKLESGQRYAFVGANGAGKTTLTKLLTGLYDEYEGDILINGKQLRLYKPSTIKSLFSVVYQQFSKYQISLKDNIALGRISQDVTDAHIQQTAIQAGLEETLHQLEQEMDTLLGKIHENGVDLSGGQWQKLAIARSLISPAPIKIMDEPTAALDPLSENQLYQTFAQLMEGKTTILITHRLGSVKLVDKIFVLEAGRLVEHGTHSQLMQHQGLYRYMFNEQEGWYQ